MSFPMLRINMTAEQAVRLHEQIEALRQERDHLKAKLAEACGEGRALLAGWISRNQGEELEQNPIPKAQDAQRQWWEKGWQWREDALALDQAQAAQRRIEQARDQLKAQLVEAKDRLEEEKRSCRRLEEACAQVERERDALQEKLAEEKAIRHSVEWDCEVAERERDALQEKLATERQGALAREEAVTEARGLFERAMSALVRNDLAEEAHALARQASWLEVRERVVVLSEGDEP